MDVLSNMDDITLLSIGLHEFAEFFWHIIEQLKTLCFNFGEPKKCAKLEVN